MLLHMSNDITVKRISPNVMRKILFNIKGSARVGLGRYFSQNNICISIYKQSFQVVYLKKYLPVFDNGKDQLHFDNYEFYFMYEVREKVEYFLYV